MTTFPFLSTPSSLVPQIKYNRPLPEKPVVHERPRSAPVARKKQTNDHAHSMNVRPRKPPSPSWFLSACPIARIISSLRRSLPPPHRQLFLLLRPHVARVRQDRRGHLLLPLFLAPDAGREGPQRVRRPGLRAGGGGGGRGDVRRGGFLQETAKAAGLPGDWLLRVWPLAAERVARMVVAVAANAV